LIYARRLQCILVLSAIACAFLTRPADAAIDGWAYNGGCYTSAQSAVDAFLWDFNVTDSTGQVWLTTRNAAPVATVGSNFTYTFSVSSQAWTATTATARTAQRIFQPCDSSQRLNTSDQLSLLWIGVACLVYGIGLVAGLNR